MTDTKQQTPRQRAEQEYRRRAAAVREWQERQGAASADLSALEERLDRVLVDAPEETGDVAQELLQKQNEVALAERALVPTLAAQREAGRALVTVLAGEMQPDLDRLRAELGKHEAETARLLQALEAHAGVQYKPRDLLKEWREGGRVGGVTVTQTPAEVLGNQIRGLEQQQRLLTAAAASENLRAAFPGLTLEGLPECLHPADGILPAEEFAADYEERQRAAAEHAAEEKRQQALRLRLDELLQPFTDLAGEVLVPAPFQFTRDTKDSLVSRVPLEWHEHLLELASIAGLDVAEKAACEVRKRTNADATAEAA